MLSEYCQMLYVGGAEGGVPVPHAGVLAGPQYSALRARHRRGRRGLRALRRRGHVARRQHASTRAFYAGGKLIKVNTQ